MALDRGSRDRARLALCMRTWYSEKTGADREQEGCISTRVRVRAELLVLMAGGGLELWLSYSAALPILFLAIMMRTKAGIHIKR